MRLLLVLALAFVAVASAQPAAPIRHAASFAGGAATCQPGQGVISAEPNAPINGCAPCLAGYFQAGTGTLACTACPAGTWSPVGSNACYKCPDGTISGVAADGCDECPFGTAAGHYGSDTTPVARDYANTYSQKSNTRCYPCDVNWYQPKAGQYECLPCPANTSTSGAKGAGACFASTGGNTVAGTGAGAAKPASLMEVENTPAAAAPSKAGPKKGLASGSAEGSSAPFIKEAAHGPKAPIRPSKRQRWTGGKGHSSAAHEAKTVGPVKAAKAHAEAKAAKPAKAKKF